MGVLSWAVAVSDAGMVRPAQSRVATANRPAIEQVRLEFIRISLPRRDDANRPLLATSLFTFTFTLPKSDAYQTAGSMPARVQRPLQERCHVSK